MKRLCEISSHGVAEIDLCHGANQRYGDLRVAAHGDGLLRGHGKGSIREGRRLPFDAQRANEILRPLARVVSEVGNGVKRIVAFGQFQHDGAHRSNIDVPGLTAVYGEQVQIDVVDAGVVRRGACRGHGPAAECHCKLLFGLRSRIKLYVRIRAGAAKKHHADDGINKFFHAAFRISS